MACILCGAADFAEVGKKGDFTIARCANCDFVYTIPVPSENELSEFYNPRNYEAFRPHCGVGRGMKYRFLLWRIKRLFPRNKRIRLLESGCNQGDLLFAARSDQQIVATGIDLDGVRVQCARSRGLRALQGTLESHNFPDECFDVVVAIHVIEHLHNPVRTLKEVNRILSRGGALISIVPCVTHIKARLAGIKWKYFRPPGHLWYFSPKTFRLLLGQTGFTPVSVSCFYNRAHLKAIARKT